MPGSFTFAFPRPPNPPFGGEGGCLIIFALTTVLRTMSGFITFCLNLTS